VRLVKPAALLQRRAEHALQARRGVGHDLLRVPEAVGIGQCLDGGVDFLCAVARLRHAAGRRATA
jgi:hypothetical protein